MQKSLLVALTASSVLFFPAAQAESQAIVATRVDAHKVRLDGRLDEAVWSDAAAATGFVQREPTEGAPAMDRTEVRFAFDHDALWIGARMFSRNPRDIRSLITRRDKEGSSERLIVSLDTHRDRRTAYSFAVTPAGVRIDYFHASDFENETSYDYNPIWEAATRIDSLGWTAELRIPFTQLRFNPGEVQEWGVNVVRVIPETNERSYLVLVRRNETGWSSRMAALTGIQGIPPARRIELLPYVAADSRFLHVTDAADPFSRDHESAIRAGGDLKMGLGPNLTLDVTINPDFGQVDADPAEVNLSAYETFFDERRPFFLEGSQLFGGRGFYYSRRIGAAPRGSGEGDYQERTDNTTILGAAKLTGRLPSGLSIAALSAITDRETVRTYDASLDAFGRSVVSPRTVYAVASAQQEFGKTRSTLGATVTTVQRSMEDDSPLRSFLADAAYSAIVDTRIRWAGGKYDMGLFAGVTHVLGDSTAILAQQLSSRRYWQRPDASHVNVDPTRRTLSGTNIGINHSKVSGKHWLWDVDLWQESPGLEPNDVGAFGDVDERGAVAQVRYRENTPRSWYRSWSAGAGAETAWNFDGDRTRGETYGFANATFANFWRFNLNTWYAPRSMSDALTRGGPLMQTLSNFGGRVELESRSGARNGWGVELSGGKDENGGWESELELSLSFRPGAQWEITFDPTYERELSSTQFVNAIPGGPASTFGTRYIFANVELSEVAARLRVNYTVTPDLTLETYLEPFAASGRYRKFGELSAARSRIINIYGEAGSTIVENADGSRTVTSGGSSFNIESNDFNVRSLRSNAVLRWEWRPGSTLYAVWQQDRSADRVLRRVRPGDIFDAFSASGDNILALKVSYWIPLR